MEMDDLWRAAEYWPFADRGDVETEVLRTARAVAEEKGCSGAVRSALERLGTDDLVPPWRRLPAVDPEGDYEEEWGVEEVLGPFLAEFGVEIDRRLTGR